MPGGVYEGADEPVNFQNGVMRRSDFSHFLLSNCTLYFSDGAGHLTAVQRPIPYYETRSARYLINCLMQGPQPCDNAPGIQTVLPDTLGDADVLGLGLSGTPLLLNLSQHAAADMAQVEPASERLMVYALVNTLTELRGVSGVCFFFAGAQPGRGGLLARRLPAGREHCAVNNGEARHEAAFGRYPPGGRGFSHDCARRPRGRGSIGRQGQPDAAARAGGVQPLCRKAL